MLTHRFGFMQVKAIFVWQQAMACDLHDVHMRSTSMQCAIRAPELLYKRAASLVAICSSVVPINGADRKARAVQSWFDQCVEQQMNCIHVWDPMSPDSLHHDQLHNTRTLTVDFDELEGTYLQPDFEQVVLKMQAAAIMRMLVVLTHSTCSLLLELLHKWHVSSCHNLKARHTSIAFLSERSPLLVAFGLVLSNHRQQQLTWDTALLALMNWRIQSVENKQRMNKMLWQLQMLGEENNTDLRDQLFIEGYMQQVQIREKLAGFKHLLAVSRRLRCAQQHQLLLVWFRAACRFVAALPQSSTAQRLQLVERCSLGASTSVLTRCLAWQRHHRELEPSGGVLSSEPVITIEDVFTMDYDEVLFIERCSAIRRLAMLVQMSRGMALRLIYKWRFNLAIINYSNLDVVNIRRRPPRRIPRRTPRWFIGAKCYITCTKCYIINKSIFVWGAGIHWKLPTHWVAT